MARIGIVLLLTFLVTASGCGKRLSELAPPVFVNNWENGLCGSTVAIDGKGEKWSEGGCENGSPGLSYVGPISAEQLDRIEAAFAAHPDPATFSSPECEGEQAPNETVTFTHRLADGSQREWVICLRSPAGAEDLTRYPVEFVETVLAFSE